MPLNALKPSVLEIALDAALPVAAAVTALARRSTEPPLAIDCTVAPTSALVVLLVMPTPMLPWLLTMARSALTLVFTPTPLWVLLFSAVAGVPMPATDTPSTRMKLPAVPAVPLSASLPVAALDMLLPRTASADCSVLVPPSGTPETTASIAELLLVAECVTAPGAALLFTCRLETTAEPAKEGAPPDTMAAVFVALLPLSTAAMELRSSEAPAAMAPELGSSHKSTRLPWLSALELAPVADWNVVTTMLPLASKTCGAPTG